MNLHSLHLMNFRNYENSFISFDGIKNAFFVGENGQGKTNFLEAIYYLSYASSFRTKKNDAIISHLHDSFFLSAKFQENDLDFSIKHTLKVNYERKKKRILFIMIQK